MSKPNGARTRKTRPASLKASKPGRGATNTTPVPSARAGTKQALLIDLLKRKNGATIAELQKATGWQAHSVRGFLSGTLKKQMGLNVSSEKAEDSPRRYRIVEKADA